MLIVTAAVVVDGGRRWRWWNAYEGIFVILYEKWLMCKMLFLVGLISSGGDRRRGGGGQWLFAVVPMIG
ncbi:hypothetical protein Hanom_Chr03g00192871 [Helianthus anomalus]